MRFEDFSSKNFPEFSKNFFKKYFVKLSSNFEDEREFFEHEILRLLV